MKSNRIKSFKFEQTSWQLSSNEILAIRYKVFIIEQHFDDNILCDLQDTDCYHLVVRNSEGLVIASGRLSPQGRIGRIAVLLPYRGVGIGSKLLSELVQIGHSHKLRNISLNAEIDNMHFYDGQKFSASGPVYMKQGVPHQMLTRKLA